MPPDRVLYWIFVIFWETDGEEARRARNGE